MKLTSKVIELPRSHYKILNSPPPSRYWVLATLTAIIVTALLWGVI